MRFKLFKSRAVELSGNPNAWSDLATWVEYHHSTLVNATVACYLHLKATIPDVAAKHLFRITLNYRNEPDLPVEKKFEMRGAHLTPVDDPECAMLFRPVNEARPAAVEMGKVEMGELYWGTGAYVLMVRFRPDLTVFGTDGVPFWKHFGIDSTTANAVPACRNPLDQLEDNLHQGRGLPTCCCGGWTHQVSGHEAKVGW
ncbi:hypothetical protein C8Q80DRAFT_830259 [Daedaleopsis nitida]|nr:hypothetical protein C8Q80DRAFT_830259 [Daedaleopsis nitida]